MTAPAQQPEKLRELLEELALIEDRELRSELLIEYSERFEEVPKEIASRPFPEEFRVPSCESEAFVFPQLEDDGKMKFYFAVENPQGISAMAFAVILDETLSGLPAEEIAGIDDSIVYDIFGRGISMGKGLGLRSMVQCVKAAATQRL